MDSSGIMGAVYQLIPVFFPGPKPSSSKTMKYFFISETGSSGNILGRNIYLTVPYSTDTSSLTADFFHTGARAMIGNFEQISKSTRNNFGSDLLYSILAENGSSQDYTVKTSKGTPTSNTMLSFSLSKNPETGSYAGMISGNVITVYVPYGTDITGLTAIFSHDGKKMQVNGTDQVSGKTVQNFSGPVTYSVYSESGAKQDFTVNVSAGENSSKDLTAVWLDSIPGLIQGTDMFANIPPEKNITSLVTNFIHTGTELRYEGKAAVSGEIAPDYSGTVSFTVIAADGSTKKYTVFAKVTDRLSIGGYVSGLGSGKSLTIQNNGGDALTLNANGGFIFSQTLAYGSTYSVSVLNYPSGQFCTVSGGSGTAKMSITDVIIDCGYPTTSVTPNLIDQGNQTILDSSSGLIWMKCSMSNVPGVPVSGSGCTVGTFGQYIYCRENDNDCNGGTNSGSYGTLVTAGYSGSYPGSYGTVYDTVTAGADHYTAYKACGDANTNPAGGFAGRTDWRVPVFAELRTIVNLNFINPSVNAAFFPATQSAAYWSATAAAANSSQVLYVGFNWGDSNVTSKAAKNYLRCVAGP